MKSSGWFITQLSGVRKPPAVCFAQLLSAALRNATKQQEATQRCPLSASQDQLPSSEPFLVSRQKVAACEDSFCVPVTLPSGRIHFPWLQLSHQAAAALCQQNQN